MKKASKEKASSSKEKVLSSKEKISTSKMKLSNSQEKSYASREKVSISREKASISKERAFIPKERGSISKEKNSFSRSMSAERSSLPGSSFQIMTSSNKNLHSQQSELPAVSGYDMSMVEENVQEDEVEEMLNPTAQKVSEVIISDEPEFKTLEEMVLDIEGPSKMAESMFPWKDNFFEKIEARSIAMQENVINKFLQQKEVEKKMDKKFPLDNLAYEWLNDNKMTLDTQAYLLEKLLPTLMPGVEKLLMEVEKRKILQSKKKIKFDPINYLGEYLMRNNPNYQKDLPETGYLKAMKDVTKEMKTQIPETPFYRISKMKSDVKEKQDQRENIKKIKSQVGKMRKEALGMQFKEWPLDADGKIPLPVIQNAVQAFQDTEAGQKIEELYHPMEFVGSMKDKTDEEGFVKEIFPVVKDLSSEMFADFLKHFCQSADDLLEIVKRDMLRQKFLQLFLACDKAKMGFLDRERILTLLENFYDKSPRIVKRLFRNPRYWPFIEFRDIEPAEFWGNLDDERNPFQALEHISSGEMKKHLLDFEKLLSQHDTEEDEEEEPKKIRPTTEKAHRDDLKPQETVSYEKIHGKLSLAKEELSPESQKRRSQEIEKRTSREEERARKSRASLKEKRDSKVPRKESESVSEGKRSSTALPQDGEKQEAAKMSQDASAVEQGQAPIEKKASLQIKESRSLGKSPMLQEESSQGQLTDLAEHKEVKGQPKVSKSASKESPPETEDKDKVCEPKSQLIEGKPWSGELLTSDLARDYMKYGENKEAYLVSEDPRFAELRPIILRILSHQEPNIRSPFTQNYLTVTQFIQLMETFVGEGISTGIMKKFINFIKKNYVETQEEKMNQLEKIQQEILELRRKILLEALFQKWDNEGSGFVDLREVDKLLFTYKEGMEKASMQKAKLHIKLPAPHPGNEIRLNVDQFTNYIELVVAELTGNESEVLDNMVEFLMTSLPRKHLEQLRSRARRKWLREIRQAAETSGVYLEPVYAAVFKALTEDAEAHGNKRISAYISLLEENKIIPERGNYLLRIVACTIDDAPFVLKQVLYRDMKGISFTVVDQGVPIYVPQVENHGNIHFWNTSRKPKDRKGSFLALPLEDAYKRSFGVLAVDTLRDSSRRSIFVAHEISYYQGVANVFSIAYHYVHSREHILHVIATAAGWLHIVASSIKSITTFLMEPGLEKDSDYVLRKVMYLDNKRQMEIFSSPAILHRKENMFRDYIFRSVDTSQVIFTHALGMFHIVVPIRDRKGLALGVLDFTISPKKMLSIQEYKDLQKMLKILQEACNEILGECSGEIKKKYFLELEHKGEVQRVGILFFRIMLKDVQGRIRELDPQAFKELQLYYDESLSVASESPAIEQDHEDDHETLSLIYEDDHQAPPLIHEDQHQAPSLIHEDQHQAPPLIHKDYQQVPTLIHDIVKAIVLMVNSEWEDIETVEDWDWCKKHITSEWIAQLCTFDPTADDVNVDITFISKCIKGHSRKAVWMQESVAIEYLYHWALTCLCLMELKQKLENKYAPPLPSGELSLHRLQIDF
ncbi:EF-hand calcium-binding domain-containing protein 5 [Antechinus flavipes]|uniref:EF-hand calcium-binding domain-containing protein 5 n=1 Tax=Antechinus flavipes TaxID=38775 RepID=UPI0022360EB9|nr:EF-hand calcium-binding domain-containing protein 5 [Antechinus flavipes]